MILEILNEKIFHFNEKEIFNLIPFNLILINIRTDKQIQTWI